jgi:hypothetical protein
MVIVNKSGIAKIVREKMNVSGHYPSICYKQFDQACYAKDFQVGKFRLCSLRYYRKIECPNRKDEQREMAITFTEVERSERYMEAVYFFYARP